MPHYPRFLAIDESWLDASDYRRRCWNYKNAANSLPDPLVRPRISLMAAIDTDGEVYMSVSQSNTDIETMGLFLRNLDTMLSEEDQNWKKKTIILWDGAGYHSGADILDVAKKLQLPLL